MSTSTLIQSYFEPSIQYVWDSITGFFYTANGKDFTIVILILIGTICVAIAGVKSIFKH